MNIKKKKKGNLSVFCEVVGQALVVQSMDNTIHWINHYPVDSIVCFANTYLPDSDLSGG